MKYLSIDLEATGLGENDLIIEFAAIPFDAKTLEINHDLSFHHYLQCPSFEQLRPVLSPWIIEHNEKLIRTAHEKGISLMQFRDGLRQYLENPAMSKYLGKGPYTLFGKSLSAIDLPFLNRDLGYDFMRKHFVHRQLDLSCFVYGLVDMGHLAPEMVSGSELMKFLGMGEVAHNALDDSVNTAKMYFELLKRFSPKTARPD